MNTCHQCGSRLKSRARFCGRCGAPVRAPEEARTKGAQESQDKPRRISRILPKRGRRWALAGSIVVLLIAAAVVAWQWFRGGGGPDDEGGQRAAVERFEELTLQGAWEELYPLVSDPPGRSPKAFAALMRQQEKKEGRVVDISRGDIVLRRSDNIDVLEVEHAVTSEKNGAQRETQVTSFFLWDGEQWLFAFSAPVEQS